MLRRVLVCLSFATWCFLNTWVELAEGQVPYFARYDPLWATVPAVVVWEAVIFAALLAGWEFCRRRRWTDAPAAEATFLALSLVPFGIGSIALLRLVPFDLVPIVRQRWFWPVVLAAISPFAAVAIGRPRLAGGWIRGLFLYSLPVLALVMVQGARATLLRYPHSAYLDRPLARPSPSQPGPVRVVWIIFDELSRPIAFDHRPAGLELPNLDRLRSQCFYAANAHAPAGATDESLPSLTLGEHVLRTEARGPDSLYLYTASRPSGFAWQTAPNVFDRARALGYNSGLAGWYHPYGRLLSHSLVACYWTAGWLLSGVGEPFDQPGIAGAMAHRARCQLAAFPLIGHLPFYAPRAYQREQTYLRYRYLFDRAAELAMDRSLGLAFIHLPVPHPPAIYSRALRQFTALGANDFLDSVALADLTLGRLRQKIEAAGLSDSTVLIVSSDHGWRMLWRGGPDWTAEEESASRGIDTSGIPFLVSFPRERTPWTYSRPLDTVVTGGMVLAILRGEIGGPEQLARWLDTP